jgi:hypothetical protein
MPNEKKDRKPHTRLSLSDRLDRVGKQIVRHEAALTKAKAARRALIEAEQEAIEARKQALAEVESL